MRMSKLKNRSQKLDQSLEMLERKSALVSIYKHDTKCCDMMRWCDKSLYAQNVSWVYFKTFKDESWIQKEQFPNKWKKLFPGYRKGDK